MESVHAKSYSSIFSTLNTKSEIEEIFEWTNTCLLYTSDAADDLRCVEFGGCRIIKKKQQKKDIM